MKNKYACSIAALLLVVTLSAVIINCIYVKSATDHILASLEELPDDIADSNSIINGIAEYWGERKEILGIALSEPELDKISSLFDELAIGAEEGNTEEYKKSMARLKRAIEDIRKHEEFSIENIF